MGYRLLNDYDPRKEQKKRQQQNGALSAPRSGNSANPFTVNNKKQTATVAGTRAAAGRTTRGTALGGSAVTPVQLPKQQLTVPKLTKVSTPAQKPTAQAPKQLKLPTIQAFGAGDYSKAGKAMERGAKTVAAGALGAAGSAVEIAGQFTPTSGQQSMGQFSGFGDLGRAVRENREKGTDIGASIRRQEQQRRVQQKQSQRNIFDAATRLTEKGQQYEQEAKKGLGTVGQFLVDMGVTGTQMAGDALANLVLPGSGLAMMGMRSYGQAAGEARRQGKSEQQQFLAGLKSAGIEVFTEKMFGAFSKVYGGAAADDVVEKLVSKLTQNTTGQALLTWIINGVGEGVEEVTSDLLNPLADRLLRLDDGKGRIYSADDLAQWGYDFLLGAAMGIAGGGTQLAHGVRQGQAQAAEDAYYSDLRRNGLGSAAAAENARQASDAMGRIMPARDGLRMPQLTTYAERQAAEYRGEKPQNVSDPRIGRLELSSEKYNPSGADISTVYGNRYRQQVKEDTIRRLGIADGKPAYLVASNITKNGQEYYVDVTKASLNKMLYTREHEMLPLERILLVDNLEKAIDNSYWAESNGDRKSRPQIDGFDTLRTSFYVDGIPYYADIKVKVVQGKNGADPQNVVYFLEPEEITSIKRVDAPSPTGALLERNIVFRDGTSTVETSVPQSGTGVNMQGMQNGGEYAAEAQTPLRMPRLVDEQGRTYEERQAASAQRVANLVADIDALRYAVDNGLHSPQLTPYEDTGISKGEWNPAKEYGLTPDEESAIVSYKSGDSYSLNGKLGSGETLTAHQRQLRDSIDSALEKLPAYSGTVYRHYNFDDFGGYEAMRAFLQGFHKGEGFDARSYWSASTAPNENRSGGEYTVDMVIQSASSRSLNGFGVNTENEVLIPHNAVLIPISMEAISPHKVRIIMREEAKNAEGTTSDLLETGMRGLRESPSGRPNVRDLSERNTGSVPAEISGAEGPGGQDPGLSGLRAGEGSGPLGQSGMARPDRGGHGTETGVSGLRGPQLTTYAQRQAAKENAEKDSIRDRLRQMDAMNDAAAERAMEQRTQQEQQGREMPEALKKLGVTPFGSEANYAGVDALAQGIRGNNSARKQMQKHMSKIPATEKERTFARRLADGTLDTADIPNTVNRETVETLADYYRTMDTTPETLLLRQRRAAIFEREEAKMEPLLGMDVAYDEGGLRTDPAGLRKPSGKISRQFSTLRRNLQTPARICATEWGTEHGKKVYEALFYPVTENNGRQIDWVNSMLDKVRTFTDSEGNARELNRKERALVQKIVEHRGAEKRVQDIQNRYETARQNAESAESIKKEKKKNAKGITVEQYLSQQGLIKADMEKRLKELSLEYSRRRKNGELEDISRAEYIEAESGPELAAYVKSKTEAKGELYAKVMTGEINSQSVMSRIQQAINGSERVRSYLDRMGLDWREYENTYYSPEAIFERGTATDRESNEYRKAKREWEAAKEMKSFLNAAHNVRNGASAADAAREFGIDPSYPEYQDLQNYQTYLEALDELNDSKSADSTAVNKAVETYSGLYKELYEGINSFLVAHGYQTIGFIEGYAPHMQPEAEKTAFSKALKLLGLDDTAMTLPTSISGKTADLKPYKQYNPFFQERHGVNTEYDIAKGFEDYVYYLGNIFYHTDDIMRIRTAEKYIRKTYSSEEASEQISWAENARNFSDDQIVDFLRMNGVIQKGTALASSDAKGLLEEYIGKLYDQIGNVTRYSEMAKYLDNYANRLAGKQNMADRGAEAATGRGSLNWINTLTGKYGGAKLAFNVSSALNQTSQIPMVVVENGERATLHAIGDFFKKGRADFARESNFLKGKKGIDWLLGPETKWEKFKEKGFAMTEAVDSFTSYVAVRSKYLKEINAGKSHAEAMKLADECGRNVMGSRARGEKPMLFDTKNPFWQIVTRFQLEALNSWEHVSRDMPNEARQMAREKGKTYAAGIMGVRVAKYLAYAFLLNLGVGALSGGSPVPYDAIGSLLEAWGKSMGVSKLAVVDDVLQSIFDIRLFGTDDDDEDDAEKDWWAFLWSLLGDVANDVPIVGQAAALAGIGDQTLATTDLSKVGDFAKSAKNNGLFSADTLDKGLTEAGEFVYGGNQLRKTLQGGIAVGRGGVYSKGNLRYQVDQTPMNYVKGLLFGRSALDESQAYYADRTSDFSENQTEAFRQMQDRGVSAKASYDLIQELRGIEKTEESTKAERQRAALRQSGISGAGKWVTYYQTMASSKEVEAMDAVQYGSETDYGTVTSLLMDLKEQDKDVDKMRLIDRSRLTDSQKASLYKSLVAGDEDLEKIDALKEVGITDYQYLQYKIATSGMTKREEKLNAINTLNLTDDQKDALYYLNSYASSTHGKAPWVQGITAAGSADRLAALLAADEDDGDDIPKWRESLNTYLGNGEDDVTQMLGNVRRLRYGGTYAGTGGLTVSQMLANVRRLRYGEPATGSVSGGALSVDEMLANVRRRRAELGV